MCLLVSAHVSIWNLSSVASALVLILGISIPRANDRKTNVRRAGDAPSLSIHTMLADSAGLLISAA
ncbi:hypothetical protein BOTBODRAFT_39516 [Botryobasidium botryosum FD-172 SS1]|uniref:Uncharacterized protein n=1 Tax=Botryobasidium botryosum (strain FD-172 SS1) TaxID=930990 RepID=A0A067LW77_BOTB1|nr:hypothetical protein BOTBODRAFT_39516 [Botryobasidium botryosum FD-172 SS1]